MANNFRGQARLAAPVNGPGLPLAPLLALRPFVDALAVRRIDIGPILKGCGLSQDLIEAPDAMVHDLVIHEFLERIAEAANDPCLGAAVASTMKVELDPLLPSAQHEAGAVGAVLSRVVELRPAALSSATPYLRQGGAMAAIGEERPFAPLVMPAQSDAFTASFWVRLLQWALGDRFDPSAVAVTVCDPRALSAQFEVMRVDAGDRLGAHVSFPAGWLSKPIEWGGAVAVASPWLLPRSPAADFLASFRQVLRAHRFDRLPASAEVAQLVAMSRPTLSRRLAASGTAIQAEVERVVFERACAALSGSDRTITDIAATLHFSSAANFARAFRRKLGESPSAYRARHQPARPDTSRSG